MKPINGYVLIEPVVHESFISSQKETYDEVGVVIAVSEEGGVFLPEGSQPIEFSTELPIKVGNKVYFDSYMAKKYPNPDKPDTFFWLVHKDEICAIDD